MMLKCVLALWLQAQYIYGYNVGYGEFNDPGSPFISPDGQNRPDGPNNPNDPNSPFIPPWLKPSPNGPNEPNGSNGPNNPNSPFIPPWLTPRPNEPNVPNGPNGPNGPNRPNGPNGPNRPYDARYNLGFEDGARSCKKHKIKSGKESIACEDCRPNCIVQSENDFYRLEYNNYELYYISPFSIEPKLNWLEAEEKCQTLFNGHLPSISSDREFDYIAKRTKALWHGSHGNGLLDYQFYIGLIRGKDEKFVWIDGSSSTWTVPWRIGQPDNHRGYESYGECFYNTKQCNDIHKNRRRPHFVCKKTCQFSQY